MNTYEIKVRSEPNGYWKDRPVSFIFFEDGNGCSVYSDQVINGCIYVREHELIDNGKYVTLEIQGNMPLYVNVDYKMYIKNRRYVFDY